jgi:hypothetical protein
LGSIRQAGWGDSERPKTHRLSAPASEPIRWRNADWPNQPEGCWRVRCTCGESFSSVDHAYALAEAQAHVCVSGAATPLSHVYWLAKRFQAGTVELDDVVFPDKDDYLLRDLLADAVAAIPRARPEPRPENADANERRRVKQDKKVCAFVHCDTVFTPSRKDQIYCKPAHKVAAYTRRKLEAARRVAGG